MLLKTISIIIGWTYVLCWSVSFYPQFLLNIRLRSSDGVSVDFLFLNALGYVSYLTSLCLQVYNDVVRSEFHERYGQYPLLSIIDIAYAAHGMVLNFIILSQLFFWKFARASSIKIHKLTEYCFALLTFTIALQVYLAYVGRIQLVDFAINLAYTKIAISFLKYIPQLYHNYTRASCHGFAISQIWLDFAGSEFSLIQLFLDIYIDNSSTFSWAEVFHNKGKLGLGVVTNFFDICFFTQYYIIYKEQQHIHSNHKRRDSTERNPSSESLLAPNQVV